MNASSAIIGLAAVLLASTIARAVEPVAPATRDRSGGVIILGSLTREFRARPGEALSDRLVLLNTGDRPRLVHLARSDYRYDADGTTTFAPPHSTVRSCGGWVLLSGSRHTVSPGAQEEIPLQILVPDDATLHGTYWCVILVEPQHLPPPTGDAAALRVHATARYAVQIVVHAGDPGESRPVIRRQAIEWTGGHPVLQLDITNEGTRWLRPRAEVRVFDTAGRLVHQLTHPSRRIHPETSVRFAFDLPRLPAGPYTAMVILDDDAELFATPAVFTLP